MKKIYLASGSKARKDILKVLGLKFKVLLVSVREKRKTGSLSYAQLVKANALAKVKAAAKKINAGIIIGADTIMVQDGKIFGKPKDLKNAKAMLKKISRKPQLVYTGIAVAEKIKDKFKVETGFEKSKVYMDKLTDKDIDNYFRKVTPLDKAGSYDIQGRGAFFIRRIEGCFYNVVGLPVRKLYLMLNKLEIKFICIFLCAMSCLLGAVFLSGCSTEYNIATGQEEAYFYSTDKEVEMGRAINKQVLEEYKPATDPLMQKRVEDIGKKIAAVCDRKDIDYHFMVLEDDDVNAVSLPGGYVYIFRGLIDKVDNDDELAGVVAHEVGHIVARHSIKRLQADQLYSILRVAVGASGQGDVGAAADAAFTELLMGYSREDELLADQLGTRYERLAGYDPRGMIKFLQKLQEINRRRPLTARSYYKTHPYIPDRIRVVRQELGHKMSFSDYINIEQKPHPGSDE